MNESLLRDLHFAQMEEIAKVQTAFAEMAQKSTVTPADITNLQDMIANIKIPVQDASHAAEALRQLQTLSKQFDDTADNQRKYLNAIYQYCKSLDEKKSNDSEVMAQGIEELKKACEKIDNKVFHFKLSHYAVQLWAVVMTLISAYCLYENHSIESQVAKMRENNLKYRYIKMKGEATPKQIAEIEDIFEYNRNDKKIQEMQKDVVAFEEAMRKKAELDEQTRLSEQESQRLEKTATELKQKTELKN
ncbi:MAG: hypothetical protein SNH27_06090 [Rikenellaceae bacterium]